MGWVTISLRKMTLKNRINTLESDLIRISQSLQTVHRESTYQQRAANLAYNLNNSIINANFMGSLNSLNADTDGDGTVSNEENINWQTSNMELNLSHMAQKQQQESIFQAQNDVLQSEADCKSQTLEAEQEQVETQLKAARAEYESLGQAMDQDIKNGAIKLTL